MKKHHSLVNLLLILFSLIPLGYLAIIWRQLPPEVPLHFNSRLEPDKYAGKGQLWVPVLILTGVSLLVFFLLLNLRWLDPKRRNAPDAPVFNKMAAGMLVFITLLNAIVITASFKGGKIIGNFMLPFLGLLFAFLGNYMHHIKPNYFAGFRLPWTLSDDENWRLTHRLAGKIWFWAGMLLAISGLLIPSRVFLPVFITTVIIMSLIPAAYSYILFRNKSNHAAP